MPALGALSGNQAMQMVRAGLKAIYLSGWQVAADANTAGAMYPDQSLYPANSGPELARKINKTLQLPEVKSKLLEAGAEVTTISTEEFAAFTKAESAKFLRIINDANLKPE